MNNGDVKNNVLIGKDGWLFLFSGDQDEFEYLKRNKNPSSESVNNLSDNINSRSEFLKSKKVPYFHIIFPSKALVYRDKLDNNVDIKSVYENNYKEKIISKGKIDNVIYPIELFINKRENEETFQKIDTHISFFGAKYIIEEILSKLDLDSDLGDYCPYIDIDVTGDLAKMIFSKDINREKIAIRNTMLFDNLDALPGNTNNIAISTNKFAKFDKRVLLIGDSFIKEVFYLMSYVFSDVIYIRSQSFQFDMFEIYRPDFVITSGVERYLSNVLPDNQGHSVLMEKYGEDNYPVSKNFSDALRANLSWKNFPIVYQNWLRNFTGINVYFDGIGHGRCNDELSAETRTEFISHGSDPQIEFELSHPNILDTFEAELNCIQETDAQLFFSFGRNSDPKFTEERSIRCHLLPGNNKVIFHLPPESISSLRFDPVQLPGEIIIKSVILKSKDREHGKVRAILGPV